MGYKLLGYLVWQRWKSQARRRARGTVRKLAVGAVLGVVIAGLIAAQKRPASR